ncbi:zinc-binding dehydrogenase [Amnibacterium kyonggiense]
MGARGRRARRRPGGGDPADRPGGVDRIVEVAFDTNVDLDAAVLRDLGVLVAFATGADRPAMPFWPLLFKNTTIRLVGSDDVPPEAKDRAAADLSAAAAAGAVSAHVGATYPLEAIAEAHDAVDGGTAHGRVLLRLD